MKFICGTCSREFDIGAPKGMQLPCPACGGMLSDEETAAASGGGAPAAAPPKPNPAAFAGTGGLPPPGPPPAHAPAPAAAEEEFNMDAAEAFASGGGAPPPAPMPPPPPPLVGPNAVPYEEPADFGQAQEDQYAAGPDGQYAVGPDGQPVGPDGRPLVGPDGQPLDMMMQPGEEMYADGPDEPIPFLVKLGWILFGISIPAMGALGALYKHSLDQIEVVRGEAAPKDEMAKLQITLNEERERANRIEKERVDLIAAADKLQVGIKAAQTKLEESQAKLRTLSQTAGQSESRLKETRAALAASQAELREIRDKVEEEMVARARLQAQATASVQAMRASELMLKPGMWADALKLLDAATAVDDQLDTAFLMRGVLLARLGKHEDALSDFDKVDALATERGAKGHPRALVAAGDICREKLGRRERALEYYRRATEAAPDSPYAVVASGRSLMLSGRNESARLLASESAAAAEKSGGDAIPIRELLMELLAAQPAFATAAMEEASRVLAADSTSVKALDTRGMMFMNTGKLEAAAADLCRAAELDPLNGERLLRLGRVQLALRRPTAAQLVLQKAAKILPGEIDVTNSLAESQIMLGEFESAVKALTEALDKQAENPVALRLRGEARCAMDQYRSGLHDLEESIRVGGESVKARILLSRTYATAKDSRYKDPRKALDNARVAVDMTEGKDPEALAALAGAFASAGDYTRAVVEMRKAVLLDPSNHSFVTELQTYERKAQ
jgi:tetratricopeptide (TPR) repeat protein